MASLKENPSEVLLSDDFEVPEGWQAIAVYESPQAAHDAGLAILAMGQAYWLQPYRAEFILCVRFDRAEGILAELDVMKHLGFAKRKPVAWSYHEFTFGLTSFVIFALIMIGGEIGQQFGPIADFGRVDAIAMVKGGEWWRSITALTLHSGIVHLVSNLVAGLGFAFFVARFFGASTGWFLILISGAAGNVLNAWVHYPNQHLSIGASTAVFSALGLMTGIGIWAALVQPSERWAMPRWLVPAFGGLTLLGLLGGGDSLDGRTDVAAHISGFGCGCFIGLCGAYTQPFFVRVEKFSVYFGLAALSLLGLAWAFALN